MPVSARSHLNLYKSLDNRKARSPKNFFTDMIAFKERKEKKLE